MSVILWGACLSLSAMAGDARLDREAIVGRHSPVWVKPDPLSPAGVGLPGAGFVFTADVTGLQTFTAVHEKAQQLNTMAEWAWHEFPNPRGFSPADVTAPYPHADGTRPYSPAKPPEGLTAEKAARWPAAAAWLRANPHRFSLGNAGLLVDGEKPSPTRLGDIRQKLDLWSGVLDSRFKIDGKEVHVVTVPMRSPDGVALRIESDLLESGKLGIELSFPGPSDTWGNTISRVNPDSHRSEMSGAGNTRRFIRTLDRTKYVADLRWTGEAKVLPGQAHHWKLTSMASRSMDVFLTFSPDEPARAAEMNFEKVRSLCVGAWKTFWTTGGIVDFEGSTDPRASELERRVVLSRYLTAIHCAGTLPPQETGLAQNSWFGKFHMEMLPWHAAQFAMWGQPAMLDTMLEYYHRILPAARATAASQACLGARWPKMTDPTGRDSPSDIGVFLAWQQPHPIYLAELLRRAEPGRKVMEKHRAIVYATADFMATFPRKGEDGKLHLLPPLIPAQESYPPGKTMDPAYELAYFRWALGIAREWRKALGDPPEPGWDRAWHDLAPLPLDGDRYATVSGPPFTLYHDHPCVAMICGWLPPPADLDMKRFGRTFDDLREKWDWQSTWGWDPPVLALAAARLGRPEDAVAELLRDSPKNRYLSNGHNYQDERLPLYLPGNGGLLHAVAAMVAGWDGAPDRPHPGFPDNGRWRIRSEGLLPVP